MRFELRRPLATGSDAKTDPRTQLTGSPIGRRQAWTAFRAAASRQNGPPVRPATKAAIAIAARYSILMAMVPPSAPRTNRALSEMVPEPCLTLALERLLACGASSSIRSSAAKGAIPRSSNASARRSKCFPLPSERRHDQKSGNESSGQDFRSTRPSLAVDYTAHVADSQRFLLQGPLFSKQALAQIAKSGGLRFHSELPAVLASGRAAGGWAPMLALSYPNEASHAQPH